MEKDTKELLLESVEALMIERGYANVKVLDITNKAGVAKGSFYTYFKTKDDILLAVLEDKKIKNASKFITIDIENNSLKKNLKEVSKAYLEIAAQNPDFFFFMMELKRVSKNEELLKKQEELFLGFLEYLNKILKLAIRKKEIKEEYEEELFKVTHLLQVILVSIVHRLAMKDHPKMCDVLKSLGSEKEIKDGIDEEEEVNLILNVFLKGIGK